MSIMPCGRRLAWHDPDSESFLSFLSKNSITAAENGAEGAVRRCTDDWTVLTHAGILRVGFQDRTVLCCVGFLQSAQSDISIIEGYRDDCAAVLISVRGKLGDLTAPGIDAVGDVKPVDADGRCDGQTMILGPHILPGAVRMVVVRRHTGSGCRRHPRGCR